MMKPNITYIVTKGSDDKTFLKGDHIKLIADGIVVCSKAKGFLLKEEFEQYKKEINIVIDESYIKKIIDRNEKKIKKLKKEIGL